jgi:two-component system sensor histidine kinase DevS
LISVSPDRAPVLKARLSGLMASWPRPPVFQILLAAYVGILLAVAVVWMALQMPGTDVRFLPDGAAIRIQATDGRVLASLPGKTQVTFTGSGDTVSDVAEALVQDYAPDSATTDVAAWYADRTRLARMLADGEVRLSWPEGAYTLRPMRQTLASLSPDVWMLLGGGLVVWIIGAWIWVLRAADWGARMFALAALGLLIAAFSGALFDAKAISAHGGLLWALNTANLIGSSLYAAATVAQFAVFPQRIVRPVWLGVLALAAVAWALGGALGWLSLEAYYAGLLAQLPVLAWLLWRQWRNAQLSPLDRGALRWIGLITLIGAGLLVVMMAAPKLMKSPSIASDGTAFGPLIVIFAGMAVAVGRYRLLDLDLWAYRLILAVLAALGLLAIDGALVLALHMQTGAAFSLSILAVAAAYLPLRTRLWRRMTQHQAVSNDALFEMAASVAFKPDPAARRAGWLDLLRRLFTPLEIADLDEAVAAPQLRQHGLELIVPATADGPATLLRYRGQGQGMFRKPDVRLATQLVGLMRQAESARESYRRGVTEERVRIARDLHDDVGARLLTSLHREDLPAARRDVREAMADIRVILSGLSGDAIALEQVIADLRHETEERLAYAGLALDWPISLGEARPRALDYGVYKVLISTVRETVTNTLKHARASRLSVEVDEEGDRLRVLLRDDGVGGEAAPVQVGGGQGLRNLRSRLEQIGGGLAFERTPDGARTELTIPLPPLGVDQP